MGRISSSIGLVSGINTSQIIDQLMTIEKQPVTVLQKRIDSVGQQKQAFTDIGTALTSLGTSSAQFRAPRTLRTLVERMAPPGPSFVLTNGADCVTFIPQLTALELPVLTLVNEYVDATALTTGLSTEDVTRALLAAKRVVFPSHFVAEIGKRMAPALRWCCPARPC